jgi:hypothetical protein
MRGFVAWSPLDVAVGICVQACQDDREGARQPIDYGSTTGVDIADLHPPASLLVPIEILPPAAQDEHLIGDRTLRTHAAGLARLLFGKIERRSMCNRAAITVSLHRRQSARDDAITIQSRWNHGAP